MDVTHKSEAPSRDVALLEPWYAGSHAAFADRWAAGSRHRVRVFGLAGRHWAWRQEASAWELGRRVADEPAPDLLVVSDYVDLPRLLGFLPPAWRAAPTLAYFHENQLTYPRAEGVRVDHHAGFANVLTAIRADVLVFNSEYHRTSFAEAGDALLRKLPRPNPRKELEDAVGRAHVVPPLPDLASVPLGSGAPAGAPLRVLFPHRLESDKDPVTFLSILADVARDHSIEAVLTGGDPDAAPPAVRAALEAARAHVVHVGYVESRDAYLELLAGSDAVVSTARHEFFGVAAAEALSAGNLPLLPPRLAYPELVDSGLTDDLEGALRRLAADPAPARDPDARRARRAAVLRHDAAGERGVRFLDALVSNAVPR